MGLNNPPKPGDALAISGFSYCLVNPGQKGLSTNFALSIAKQEIWGWRNDSVGKSTW